MTTFQSILKDLKSLNPMYVSIGTGVFILFVGLIIVWAAGGFDSGSTGGVADDDVDTSVDVTTPEPPVTVSTSTATSTPSLTKHYITGPSLNYGAQVAINRAGTIVAVSETATDAGDLVVHFYDIVDDQAVFKATSPALTWHLTTPVLGDFVFNYGGNYMLIFEYTGTDGSFRVLETVAGTVVYDYKLDNTSTLGFTCDEGGWGDDANNSILLSASASNLVIPYVYDSDTTSWSASVNNLATTYIKLRFNNSHIVSWELPNLVTYRVDDIETIVSGGITLTPPDGAASTWGSNFMISSTGLQLAVADYPASVSTAEDSKVYVYSRATLLSSWTLLGSTTTDGTNGRMGTLMAWQGESNIMISSNESLISARVMEMYSITSGAPVLVFTLPMSPDSALASNQIATAHDSVSFAIGEYHSSIASFGRLGFYTYK